MLPPCGLISRKQPPSVSEHLGPTFWVVAYGSFNLFIFKQTATSGYGIREKLKVFN